MEAVVTAPAPTGPATDKFVIELADARQSLRQVPNVLWKSARLEHKETGLCSRYLSDPPGGKCYVVRTEDAYHLPGYGAVVDKRGRLFTQSLARATDTSTRLETMPGFRSKRDMLMFYPERDVPRLGPASLFCNWPSQFNYAHFLLDSLTSLAVLDDIGALETHPPLAPPLDSWRRDLVHLYLGDRAGLLRETAAPIVRLESAVFSSVMGVVNRPPASGLRLLRERLLSHALAATGRAKACRRIYFTRSDTRRTAAHKRLYADLREQGFAIVDPVKLTPAEQIILVSRAHVIVGPTSAALANVLFAPVGTRVIELHAGPAAGGWVSRLCEASGMRWSALPCASTGEDLPLSGVYDEAVQEENLSVEALMAAIAERIEV